MANLPKKWIFIAFSAWLVACSAPTTPPLAVPTAPPATATPQAVATAAPPEKVHAAWVAITGNQAPAWLAKEGGIFPKYGLDVDLVFIQGSATATSSLLAGSTDIVQMAGPAAVAATSKGGDVVMIAGFVNISVFKLMADPSIKSVSDLKGKTIAITRFGSSDEFVLKKILKDNGLQAGKDVQISQAQDASGQLAVFKSKLADAILLSPPNDVIARKQGAVELVDTIPLKMPYQAIGLATTKGYLKAHRSTALNFLKAEIDAIRRFKSDRAFAESVMGKYLQTTDPDVLTASWDAYAPSFADVPYPSLPGIQQILDESDTKGFKPEDFVDSSLVKELEDSGFFKK